MCLNISAATKDIYYREAEMLNSDNFYEASKKFGTIHNSIQHLSLSMNGDANVVFNADAIKPIEEIKFTTIVFDGLVVKMQAYEKERENRDRGRQID